MRTEADIRLLDKQIAKKYAELKKLKERKANLEKRKIKEEK